MKPFQVKRAAQGRKPRLAFEVLEDRCLPSVIYNQSVSGPLSSNQADPTPLTLGPGTNSVIATVGTGQIQDWITVHVPSGVSLSSIVLASYQSNDQQGFIGVQKGTAFVGNPETASPYLGYSHFGTGATNGALPPTNLVGKDILALMANASLAQGSQGFTPPLNSGDYTFLIQQLGASTAYQFDFDTTATAPTLQSIAVTPANPSVGKGLTQQFTATGTFSDNSHQILTSQVTWASATTSVATITTAGLASGVGAGTSTISAKFNGITGSTVLTVTAPTLQSIAVTPINPSVAKGLTEQFTATGTFSDNSQQNLTSQVTWGSATTSIATITAAGLASGVGGGTSTISAKLNGVTGSTVLTVTAPATPTKLVVTNLSPTSVTAGGTVTFSVTAEDSTGAAVSGYSGTVQLTSTDGHATAGGVSLPTSYTFVTGDHGEHSFTVTLASAGSQTITATDQANNTLTATTGPIAVNPGPFSKFSVNVPGGNSMVAGNLFQVTVQAADAFGNALTSYSGPSSVLIAASPPDPQGNFPITGTLNASGFGFFLGSLKTAGSYTLMTTAGTFSGTSGSITVTPSTASFFTVAAPPTATTGSSVNITVTAVDHFGNVATGYAGHVHFSSTDDHATLPADSTLTNGVSTFAVMLNTSGNQAITATDSVSTNPTITGTSSAVTTRGLVVVGNPTVTATGFTIGFSKPFIPADVALFGSSAKTVPDVTLVGKASGPIGGTLLIDPSNMSVTFKATNSSLASFFGTPVLADDTYTVTLVSGSGSSGFLDALGAGLDGADNGGHADYTTTFTVTNAGKSILSIPDFARGPDGANAIKLPNDTGHGIPVTLSNAVNVKDVTFTLSYNPSLLTVMGASTGDSSGAGSTFTLVGTPAIIDTTHATANFSFHNGTAQSGTVLLGDITADVPNTAASLYKSKELLDLGTITVNGAAFTGLVASGVHVNAYAGDVTGNGTIDGLDVATANSVSQGNATGFAAYQLLDPAIVGDVASDISVDAGDVSTLASFVSRLPTPMIPSIPGGMTITPVGADPTLSLGQPQSGKDIRRQGDKTTSGELVTVPVLLDNPRPEGSTGMTEAVLALSYDPSVLNVSASDFTLGSIPSQGLGWQLVSVVDSATGQIGIELYSTVAITATDPGSLVNITFHVAPGASLSPTAVRLVSSALPHGQSFITQVDDAQGQLVLSPVTEGVVIGATPGSTAIIDRVFARWSSIDSHGEDVWRNRRVGTSDDPSPWKPSFSVNEDA
jgi:hypothetical protein